MRVLTQLFVAHGKKHQKRRIFENIMF